MLTSRAPVVGVSGRAETRPFSARCPDVIHSQLRLQEGRLKQSRKTRSRLSFSLDLVRSFHCICLIFFSCHVVLYGCFHAAVFGRALWEFRAQVLAGSGGCSGEDRQREVHFQVPDSAHDTADGCL